MWKKKYARIKLDSLQREKDAGGLAIPNVLLYLVASQLQHFIGCSRNEDLGGDRRLLIDCSGWSNLGSWLDTGFPIAHTSSDLQGLGNGEKVLWDSLATPNSCRFWHNPILPELDKLDEFGTCLINSSLNRVYLLGSRFDIYV